MMKMAWMAIRWMGLRPIAQAARYAFLRDLIERRWGKGTTEAPWETWGKVKEVTPVPRGVRVHLERGELDLLFLTKDMVRVSWLPGTPPVSYAIAKGVEAWPPLRPQLQTADNGWILSTGAAQVQIETSGTLRFANKKGKVLREALPPVRAGEHVCDRAHLRPREALFGLGEKTTTGNRRGHTYTLWNRDPGGYDSGDDPIYLNIPAYVGLTPLGGYLVFYENPYRALFDLGDSEKDLARHVFEGGMLRYYIILGNPPHLLERYTELTGRPPLPPLWFLGYQQSRYSYYPEARVREIAATFERHEIPVDVIHLDIHYMHGYRVFTWDRERFPQPKQLAEDLRRKGIRLVAIIDPGVKVDSRYPLYTDGTRKGVFCTLPNGTPLQAPVWPGWCVFPDFTNPQVRAWWGNQYQKLLEVGIAGFWNDMNEPATFVAWGEPTFPLPTRHHLEGRGGDHREAHNVYGLQMVRASYEGLKRLAPERRHVVVSRSGWAGLQRYGWHWTGDNRSTWDSLALTIPMVLGLGLSGIPFTGPDVGGFMDAPTAELYTRWLQMAAFFPFFRTHTAFGTPDQEPWSFGQPYLDINRETIRMRYRLLAYLYTLAWEAYAHGWPPIRPLWWLDPQDTQLWEVEDAFLVGNHLLVAPVLKEGARSRSLHLPPGEWYDFWTGERYEGGRIVHVPAPLEHISVLVRAGTVLPLLEPASNTDRLSRKRIYLRVYPPGKEDVTTLLYTDAGDGWGYEQGDYRLDTFHIWKEKARFILEWQTSHQGNWPYGECEWQMVGGTKRLEVDNRPVQAEGGHWRTRMPIRHLVWEA